MLAPSTDTSLTRCRALIEKYSDVPMDFADATLVVLAEELNTDLIFTMDSDFGSTASGAAGRFALSPSCSRMTLQAGGVLKVELI